MILINEDAILILAFESPYILMQPLESLRILPPDGSSIQRPFFFAQSSTVEALF